MHEYQFYTESYSNSPCIMTELLPVCLYELSFLTHPRFSWLFYSLYITYLNKELKYILVSIRSSMLFFVIITV